MMRARNLKPGFFKNENLAACRELARLLFAGLWCLADRNGRLEDRPKRIKAEILPFDDCDADQLLSELASSGFILRYEASGIKVIQVKAFEKHQCPHFKESASTLPTPAQGKTEAILGRDQGQTEYCPELALLNPSSLNPSSLNPSRKRARTASPKTNFTIPTIEDVSAYCRERANQIDPQQFVDYYTSNGWKVGRTAMKDWRAAVRTWEKNGFSNTKGQNGYAKPGTGPTRPSKRYVEPEPD